MFENWIDMLRNPDFIMEGYSPTASVKRCLLSYFATNSNRVSHTHVHQPSDDSYARYNQPEGQLAYCYGSTINQTRNEDGLYNSIGKAPALYLSNLILAWGKVYSLYDYWEFNRDDGWPALITLWGFRMHMRDGKLHRSNSYAMGFESGEISWFRKDRNYRGDGPHTLRFEGYREYWIDGQLQSIKYRSLSETWNLIQTSRSFSDTNPTTCRFKKDNRSINVTCQWGKQSNSVNEYFSEPPEIDPLSNQFFKHQFDLGRFLIEFHA